MAGHGPVAIASGALRAEILRVLDSLQLTAAHAVSTPADWKQGEDVIIVPAVSDAEAKAVRIERGCRAHDAQARAVREQRRARLRVVDRAPDVAAVGGADDDRG